MMGTYFTSLAVGKPSGEDGARDMRSPCGCKGGARMLNEKIRTAGEEPALAFPSRPVLCPLGNVLYRHVNTAGSRDWDQKWHCWA